ncbi:MAG: DUF1232 domain-containing protein [Desulfuromonas sp.]|uniref:DUF1232 domain-containing protein n=1 Tax=Desulfuromonas sp. TaxID=892 RepID=UPI000CB51C6C|nr:DUF1232 domain-containing protein [Desulfuromonas sp.]PLX83489.1 MAG: DUF1232 domain-containing protein [Desulfuromonas sp.]
MRGVVVALLGIFALVYVLNPGAGFFEIIPDNIPLLGNLDEAGAVALLLACLRYFGIDLLNIFGSKDPRDITPEN